MKWDEADENRERRKAENRRVMLEGDAEAVAFLDTVLAAFGGRLEWWKCGETILGRGAYEESVREARESRARLRRWHEVSQTVRENYLKPKVSLSRKPVAGYAGGSTGFRTRKGIGATKSGSRGNRTF